MPRYFIGDEQDQIFRLNCRLVRLVSLFQHRAFEFPECFIVIRASLLSRQPVLKREIIARRPILFSYTNAQIFPPFLVNNPDRPITTEVLRGNNWTMVSAIPSYRDAVEHGPYDFVPTCPIHTLVLVDTFVQ